MRNPRHFNRRTENVYCVARGDRVWVFDAETGLLMDPDYAKRRLKRTSFFVDCAFLTGIRRAAGLPQVNEAYFRRPVVEECALWKDDVLPVGG